MRRLSLIVVLALAALLVGNVPAAAVGPFGSDVILADCIPGPMGASIASDGTTRGFIPCTGGVGDGAIGYFRHKPGLALVKDPSPYTGKVLATAWDGVDALYVIFTQGSDLKVAKRTESTGAYSGTTLLASGAGVVPFTADVVASAGKWWAVWSAQTGPGGEFAQTELFQRHTLLGAAATTRITHTAASVGDAQPTLGYNGGLVTLISSRTTNPAIPGPSDLRIATSTGGSWTSTTLASAGTTNDRPDSVNVNGVTYVAWQRDGAIVQADNAGGTFATHTFATHGVGPKVGASGGRVFVGWTIGSSSSQQLFFAERSAGSWTGVVLASFPGVAAAVLGQGGKARAIYGEDERFHLRAQT